MGPRTGHARSHRRRRCRVRAPPDHGALHVVEGRAPADPAHVPGGCRASRACARYLRGRARYTGRAGAGARDRPGAPGASASGRGARPSAPRLARAGGRGDPRSTRRLDKGSERIRAGTVPRVRSGTWVLARAPNPAWRRRSLVGREMAIPTPSVGEEDWLARRSPHRKDGVVSRPETHSMIPEPVAVIDRSEILEGKLPEVETVIK